MKALFSTFSGWCYYSLSFQRIYMISLCRLEMHRYLLFRYRLCNQNSFLVCSSNRQRRKNHRKINWTLSSYFGTIPNAVPHWLYHGNCFSFKPNRKYNKQLRQNWIFVLLSLLSNSAKCWHKSNVYLPHRGRFID